MIQKQPSHHRPGGSGGRCQLLLASPEPSPAVYAWVPWPCRRQKN